MTYRAIYRYLPQAAAAQADGPRDEVCHTRAPSPCPRTKEKPNGPLTSPSIAARGLRRGRGGAHRAEPLRRRGRDLLVRAGDRGPVHGDPLLSGTLRLGDRHRPDGQLPDAPQRHAVREHRADRGPDPERLGVDMARRDQRSRRQEGGRDREVARRVDSHGRDGAAGLGPLRAAPRSRRRAADPRAAAATARRQLGLQRLALGGALVARPAEGTVVLHEGHRLQAAGAEARRPALHRIRHGWQTSRRAHEARAERDPGALDAVCRRVGLERNPRARLAERRQGIARAAEIDKPAAGANRVALIADPTGGALFLYQLDARATADPAVVADSNANNMRAKRDDPFNDGGAAGGNVNVSFSLSYATGFGPGWGTMYPVMPGGAFGPY